MRSRLLLVCLGVLLLGSIAWIVVGSSARNGSKPSTRPRGEPATGAAAAELDAPTAEPASAPTPTEREAVVVATPPVTEAEVDPSAENPWEILVTGTIVVVDELDVEHPRESGKLVISAWGSGGTGRELSVDVLEGAFDFRLPADFKLFIWDVRLGGRLAVLGSEARSLPQDRRLALRATWARSTRLVVRAADTGRELDRIQGLEVEAGRRDVPKPEETLVELGASPVTLAATRTDWNELRAFFLRAPGYAWQVVEIDLSAGGERVVELVPAGALEVRIVGDPPALEGDAAAPKKIWLRVRPTERRWWCETEMELGSTPAAHRIDSLPAGRKSVSLERGHDPVPLTIAEVEVVAGATASIELDLEAVTPLELAPLAGTLRLPATWGFAPGSLRIRSAEPRGGRWHQVEDPADFQRIEGDPDLWSWSVAPVEPGGYVVSLAGTTTSVLVDVPSSGRTDVHIVVAPPAEVEVIVVERASGARAPVETVLWSAVPPGGTRSSSFEEAEWRAEAGVWILRCPQGGIDLNVWDDAYERVSQRVEVLPGTNRFTLELVRACGVVLRVADGDTALPWPDGIHAKLTALEGFGGTRSVNWNDDHLRIQASEPGRYRIDLDDVPGYLPVADEEVEVPPETYVEHVVHLVRKP